MVGERAEAILDFWFGAGDAPLANKDQWFLSDPELDDRIRALFSADLDALVHGDRHAWLLTPRTTLAAVVCVDQFSRNLNRGSAAAFANDGIAQDLLRQALHRGYSDELSAIENYFLLMPLMHAEDADLQDEGVRRFSGLAASVSDPALREVLNTAHNYARRHAAIIYLFGRFPHRNERLGRATTEAEATFLTLPGVAFG